MMSDYLYEELIVTHKENSYVPRNGRVVIIFCEHTLHCKGNTSIKGSDSPTSVGLVCLPLSWRDTCIPHDNSCFCDQSDV